MPDGSKPEGHAGAWWIDWPERRGGPRRRGRYSLGTRQRLGIAAALLKDPETADQDSRRSRATRAGSRSPCVDRPGRCPTLALRPRHGYAADLPRDLPAAAITRPGGRPPTSVGGGHRRPAHIQHVRASLRGITTLVPYGHLPVSLTGPRAVWQYRHRPVFVGAASHPFRRLPGRAAPSFASPLRRDGGGVLSPRLDNQAPRGAPIADTTVCTRSSRSGWPRREGLPGRGDPSSLRRAREVQKSFSRWGRQPRELGAGRPRRATRQSTGGLSRLPRRQPRGGPAPRGRQAVPAR